MSEYIADKNQTDKTFDDDDIKSSEYKEESSEDYYLAFKLAITDENYI